MLQEFGLYPRKNGSGRRWASEKRTRGVDVGRLRPNHYNCLDNTVGAHREFARTSLKVSGRSLGTRWEIAGGRP
ncbi:hypothetical protein B296_00015787 [Ensete ventricosum]|uniref:Uncharacterized protein n=1 Tax=Ensete ventricosum TaxID=4639 RepID=A0A426ZW88_ENSVE|nr:hypothetical protein B296_00015787 [Ensete ventricosum]